MIYRKVAIAGSGRRGGVSGTSRKIKMQSPPNHGHFSIKAATMNTTGDLQY
jgi:hypothetical protein